MFEGLGILSLWVLAGPQRSQVAEPALSLSSLTPMNFLTALPTPTSQHGNNPILLDYSSLLSAAAFVYYFFKHSRFN